MNKLLLRQLVKQWGSVDNVPKDLLPFLETISVTYDHHDKDRAMLERSIDISSKEMIELNERLRAESRELEKAHRELKTLFDNIETVFFTVDMTQHKLIQMSASCEKIYGFTAADFLNNPDLWYTVIPEEDRPAVDNNYATMHAGETFSHSHRIVAKDGTVRWVETKITPTLNAERKVIRIDGITTDVTEKKAAEEINRRQEARYRNLIEKSHDGISLLSADGQLLYVSPSVERILGYSPDELIGTNASLYTHPEDHAWLVVLLSEIMTRRNESKKAVYRMRNKQGEWRWISSAITNLLHDESVKALVFNFEDITARRMAEQQIEFDRRNRDALINNTSDLIWSFDKDIRLITANNAFLKAYKHVTGTDLNPGDPLLDENYFPEEVLSKWEKIYGRVLRGESFVFENHESQPAEQWAELSLNPIVENGKVIGGSCTWHDITDKIQQSERIVASERMMAEAQRISNFGSWEVSFDENEEIIQDSLVWSKQVYRILGYPETYYPGYNDSFLSVHPKDRNFVHEWLNAVIMNESPGSIDHRMCTPSGEIRWVKTSAHLICDPEKGNKIKVVGTIQDITVRKSLELERSEAVKDLVQRNNDLQQFAHIVSHNLRAPVANIKGLVHLIRLTEADQKTREDCISGLAISAQRLDDIIIDLNKILQVKRGMTQENKVLVNFENLVENITGSIQLQIEQAEATINTDFSAVAEMYTIKNYLHSVFFNLISNSLKYRKRNVQPVIEIKSKVADGKTILSFKDNCIGIDLEKHGDQVFGLYKRFNSDTEGKGLGMFMVKTQVESLGGKVAINSKVNEGTEITIEFAAAS